MKTITINVTADDIAKGERGKALAARIVGEQ